MGPKRIALVLVVAAVAVVAVLKLPRGGNDKVLRIATWSNYFPEQVIADFTKKTGIKLELSYFSSNEELMAKLKAGATGYDVIQPSDYMVRQMIQMGMIQPLDATGLPNLSNLESGYRNPPYDPGLKYTVPFTWGTTGIAINTDKVSVPSEGISWRFLLESPDPKHTALLDDMREVFAAVLKSEGNSINTVDPATLESARKRIGDIKGKILMFNSEPKALLLKEELTIAHIFSCDAAQATKENPKIRYFIPREGGTLWTDNFAIPTSSTKTKEAHAFINYVLDPDVALSIVREKALATPNQAARLKLTPEEAGNPTVYPPKAILDQGEYLKDIGETLQLVSRMWTELKS